MKVDHLKLVRKLDAIKRRIAEETGSVAVGYNAAHALALHEMTPKHAGEARPSGLGVRWGPSLYGSKFLEGPARQFAAEVGQTIKDELRAGASMLQSLFVGGLVIQRESQLRVPVEHGDLKRSAFAERERQ